MIFFPHLLYELESIKTSKNYLSFILYILTFYMMVFEVIHLIDKRLFGLTFNHMISTVSGLLNLFLLYKYDPNQPQRADAEEYPIQTLVATAVLLMWYQIIQWLRLFRNYGFFMDLLIKTMNDVNFKPFFIVTSLMILSSANLFWILNIGRARYGGPENSPIFDSYMEYDFLNALFFTYINVMGEYRIEGLQGEHKTFMWVIFFGATFLIQITFLNMLIAIMQNSFQQALEIKQVSTMKGRIKIISDFRLVLSLLKKEVKFQYIFTIKPQVFDRD